MWIRTRPASASIRLEARTPTSDDPIPTQEVIWFGLLPTDEHDHLNLDTGEVFQDYNYARLDKNEQKLIDASITIRAIPDGSYYEKNLMCYRGEVKTDDFYSPSSIDFDVFIAPTAFRELAGNLRSGFLPETITIDLPSPSFFTRRYSDGRVEKGGPVEYGWEPDGSGMIWHNKRNPEIPVKSIRFDFPVVKPRKQAGRLLPAPSNAPAERTSEQIALIQTILADLLKHLRWITIGIVALVIMGILILIQRNLF
jgi:hypothetical protein